MNQQRQILNKYVFPATEGQERLWFLSNCDPKLSAAYNIATHFKIDEVVDYTALQKSINYLVNRHESLRTALIMIESELCQVIEPQLFLTIKFYDFSHMSDQKFSSELQRTLREDAEKSFDLTKPGLLRCILIKKNVQEYYFLIVMHHMISDGISMEIFIDEMQIAYRSYQINQAPNLPNLEYQYVDIQNAKKLMNNNQYWENELKDFVPRNIFSNKKIVNEESPWRGSSQNFSLNDSIIAKFSQENSVNHYSNSINFLSAYALIIYYYSGSTDFVIGVPTANRRCEEAKYVIGFFANTILIRISIKPGMKLLDLLTQIKQKIVDGISNEEFSYLSMASKLLKLKNNNINSVLEVMFGYQERLNLYDIEHPLLKNRQFTETTNAKFSLSLFVIHEQKKFDFLIEFKNACFSKKKIQKIIKHYLHLVKTITANNLDLDLLDIILTTDFHHKEVKSNILKYSKIIEEKINPENCSVFSSNDSAYELTDIEFRLINIIQNVLKIADPIPINKNLFELGSNSILIAKIANMIYEEFNLNISIRNIFNDPTIMAIAKQINELSPTIVSNSQINSLTQEEIDQLLNEIH